MITPTVFTANFAGPNYSQPAPQATGTAPGSLGLGEACSDSAQCTNGWPVTLPRQMVQFLDVELSGAPAHPIFNA